jgi:putative ABC transport system permease protein
VSAGAGLDGGPAPVSRGLRAAGLEDDIDRSAVITGSDLRVGGEVAWVHAYRPFETEEGEPIGEPLDLPIDRGRPPANDREIALGTLTMETADVSLGDTVTVESLSTGDRVEVEVVGTTMVNDTFEASPGRGGAATPELLAKIAPEVMAQGDPVVFSLKAGVDAQAFMDQIRQHVDTPVEGPVQQAAVRNVGRIRYLPYVMAAVVTLLAVASLVHALVLSVGRHGRVLGLLKGLGFTRRQVGSTVAWHATSYAVVALVVALPLGVASGRWGWRLVAETLGVPPVSVVPFLAPALGAVAFLALANLAAVYPAWRAARLSTAAALRTE